MYFSEEKKRCSLYYIKKQYILSMKVTWMIQMWTNICQQKRRNNVLTAPRQLEIIHILQQFRLEWAKDKQKIRKEKKTSGINVSPCNPQNQEKGHRNKLRERQRVWTRQRGPHPSLNMYRVERKIQAELGESVCPCISLPEDVTKRKRAQFAPEVKSYIDPAIETQGMKRSGTIQTINDRFGFPIDWEVQNLSIVFKPKKTPRGKELSPCLGTLVPIPADVKTFLMR